jgi:3-oxoacyl-[acyl-carrier protein] reductase
MIVQDKVALVLGAVKGIGKEIGLALARQGAKLVLTRHDWTDSFAAMEKAFADTSAEHTIETMDLRQTENIEALVQRIKKQYGRMDILVNNIERGGWPVVHGEYTEDQWDLELETTLRTKRWILNESMPLLLEAQEAAVINFSSVAALTGRSGPSSLLFNDGYSAASRGVSSLTETYARIGAPSVRVNELMLGVFASRHAQGTRGWEEVLSDAEKQAIIDHIPAGRTGSVQDAVKACMFLIKDAPYMTGSTLRLDGGYVLGGEKVPPMPEGIFSQET